PSLQARPYLSDCYRVSTRSTSTFGNCIAHLLQHTRLAFWQIYTAAYAGTTTILRPEQISPFSFSQVWTRSHYRRRSSCSHERSASTAREGSAALRWRSWRE